MEFTLVEREGIEAAIETVTKSFFSGDRAEVERHFVGHADGDSSTLLAYDNGELVGILTIRWRCKYPPFAAENIPLIQYIEVKWERRGQGIGNALMAEAERYAMTRTPKIGLCVGLFDAYGPAQRLYARRGYIPDGRGVCRGHSPLKEGESVVMSHDLLLWLVKNVTGHSGTGADAILGRALTP